MNVCLPVLVIQFRSPQSHKKHEQKQFLKSVCLSLNIFYQNSDRFLSILISFRKKTRLFSSVTKWLICANVILNFEKQPNSLDSQNYPFISAFILFIIVKHVQTVLIKCLNTAMDAYEGECWY